LGVFSIGNIIAPLNAAGKAANAARDFFAMIDKRPLQLEGLKDPDVTAASDIHFGNVTFAYPSRPHVKVLDDFSATFEAGKLTAIVGPSGSGKSTIVGLIERWYGLSNEESTATAKASNPDRDGKLGPAAEDMCTVLGGMITIGGIDLADLDLRWWRSQIGLVQQEPFIFNDTIYTNVAHGLVGTKLEEENDKVKRSLVEEACREAFADEFITRLPMVRLVLDICFLLSNTN
jgi:ATP-binding cassette subfamily B (MDR/TAP) protein 1